MKLKRSGLDKALEALCLLILFGTAAFLAVYWGRIPRKIPMHYDAAGNIDRYGEKGELLTVFAMALAAYVLVSAVERFPSLWNTGVTVTEENRERVYAILLHMLLTVKLLAVLLFSALSLLSAMRANVPLWGFMAWFALFAAALIYWFGRLILIFNINAAIKYRPINKMILRRSACRAAANRTWLILLRQLFNCRSNKNLQFAPVFFAPDRVSRLDNTSSIFCGVFLVWHEKSLPLG